jgi:undecaprenyl-diphosphatase
MQGARVPGVQQPCEGLAIGIVPPHRPLEQGLLNIARHIAPNGQRGIAEQKRKSLFIILHRGSLLSARVRDRSIREQTIVADVPHTLSWRRHQKAIGSAEADGVAPMAGLTIQPTAADKAIANAIAAHTTPNLERASRLLTLAADEKVLLAIAAGGWLYATYRPALRPITNHLLAVSMLGAILPHLLKAEIDQIRPDRLTVRGHWRGVPFSGRSRDSFPSGHALHMGALASAAGLFPPAQRRIARGLAIALSATRILLLAHWASDVATGFAAGALLERLVRPVTLGQTGKGAKGHRTGAA